MKVFFYLLLFCFFSISCSSERKNIKESTTALSTHRIKEIVPIKLIDHYYSIMNPSQTQELILDSMEFKQYFHSAATMSGTPTAIHFNTEKVGAIILPETNVDTRINIDSIFIDNNNILNISYSVNKGTEARSFTTIPTKLFSINTDLSYDSTVFIRK